MRAESFDLAVQIHGPGAHANPQVSLLGARLTAGCHGVSALQLERSLPHLSTQHEVFRWLDVVAQVGAQGMPTEAVLTLTKEDEAAAADALPASAGELVALNPGSFSAASAVARREVYVTSPPDGRTRCPGGFSLGSAADAPLAASVQEELQGQAIDLTGKLTERALAGVLVRCRLVVGNDSDALRLAQVVTNAHGRHLLVAHTDERRPAAARPAQGGRRLELCLPHLWRRPHPGPLRSRGLPGCRGVGRGSAAGCVRTARPLAAVPEVQGNQEQNRADNRCPDTYGAKGATRRLLGDELVEHSRQTRSPPTQCRCTPTCRGDGR